MLRWAPHQMLGKGKSSWTCSPQQVGFSFESVGVFCVFSCRFIFYLFLYHSRHFFFVCLCFSLPPLNSEFLLSLSVCVLFFSALFRRARYVCAWLGACACAFACVCAWLCARFRQRVFMLVYLCVCYNPCVFCMPVCPSVYLFASLFGHTCYRMHIMFTWKWM